MLSVEKTKFKDHHFDLEIENFQVQTVGVSPIVVSYRTPWSREVPFAKTPAELFIKNRKCVYQQQIITDCNFENDLLAGFPENHLPLTQESWNWNACSVRALRWKSSIFKPTWRSLNAVFSKASTGFYIKTKKLNSSVWKPHKISKSRVPPPSRCVPKRCSMPSLENLCAAVGRLPSGRSVLPLWFWDQGEVFFSNTS